MFYGSSRNLAMSMIMVNYAGSIDIHVDRTRFTIDDHIAES